MRPVRRARGPAFVPAGRLVVLGLLGLAGAAGCARPLPEEGSPQARLYAERCGSCHRPYAPGSLGPAMWKFQLGRMDEKFRVAGQRPPSQAERSEILDYLTRHAGG